jgi:hypothetical protein
MTTNDINTAEYQARLHHLRTLLAERLKRQGEESIRN